MGFRIKSVSELEEELATGDINKITIPKCSYLALSNNYHSSLAILLDGYQTDKEKFFNLLNRQNDDILKKIAEKHLPIDNSCKDLADIKLAEEIFTENCSLRYKLIAAERSLNRIYQLLKDEEKYYFDTEYYEGLIYLFGNIFFDIESLISTAHRRTLQDVGRDIFKLSKDLLRTYCMPNAPVIPTTIFLIRQTIELSIKRLFNFISICQKNTSKDIKIPISKFLEFLSEKEESLNWPVPISLLIKINKWSNYYIHTGNFRQMYWEVEWAHYLLTDFVYADIQLTYNYKKEFEEFLKNKYKDIKIIWK